MTFNKNMWLNFLDKNIIGQVDANMTFCQWAMI